jgi:transcriptional regulator with XRE-family HTH domain
MKVGKIMYHYQRLRDLREDADLKQRQIAELLDMTAQQYSLYERGVREIPFHHVITLAKYYGVSIDYIAGLTNQTNRK